MSLVMPELDRAVLDRRAEIAAALRKIVPGEGVIDSVEAMRPYESDGLTAYRTPPMLVALPETTAQVSEVLRYCHAEGIKEYLEGVELTSVRCALFVAGDVEPVKRLVQGESGSAYRVPGKAKIRELMGFAVSEDLAALRTAVGTAVEVSRR